MAVVKYTTNDIALLARLMRAEAEADGQLGELLVGNVGINRVLAHCLDFKNIRTIQQMIFQSPGGFTATQFGYFYQGAREIEKRLAKRVIAGQRFVPATTALYFYEPAEGASCRAQWFGQWNSGRFKGHCFFQPTPSEQCY